MKYFNTGSEKNTGEYIIFRKQELELNSFLFVFTWRLQDTFNKTKTDRGFFIFKCQTKLNLRANRQMEKEGGIVVGK